MNGSASQPHHLQFIPQIRFVITKHCTRFTFHSYVIHKKKPFFPNPYSITEKFSSYFISFFTLISLYEETQQQEFQIKYLLTLSLLICVFQCVTYTVHRGLFTLLALRLLFYVQDKSLEDTQLVHSDLDYTFFHCQSWISLNQENILNPEMSNET